MRIGRRQDGRDRDGRLGVDLVRVVLAWTKVVLVVHMGEQWVYLGAKLDVLGDGYAGAEGGVRQLPVPSWHN